MYVCFMFVLETIHLCMHMRMYVSMYMYMEACLCVRVYACMLKYFHVLASVWH